MVQQASTAQQAIPFKRDSEGAATLASSGMGVLIVSVLVIAAVLVIRKRLRIGAPTGGKAMLHVLETQRLGPRALVSVIEFKGTQYLLVQSEQGIHCLASVPAGDQPCA